MVLPLGSPMKLSMRGGEGAGMDRTDMYNHHLNIQGGEVLYERIYCEYQVDTTNFNSACLMGALVFLKVN